MLSKRFQHKRKGFDKEAGRVLIRDDGEKKKKKKGGLITSFQSGQ